MKKLLYIAPVVIDLDNLNGVSKKILNQIKVFGKYFEVELISYGPDCLYYHHNDTIDKIPLGNLNRRLKLYHVVNRDLSNNKFDNIYIRYHLSDFLFIFLLRRLRQNGIKILIEIPTFPYKQELLKSKNGLLRYISDNAAKLFLKLYVDRIVTYSKDRFIYGIKTINTINGIIYDEVIPISNKIRIKEEVNVISVSMTVPCHGYDRLIEGIHNYYKNGGSVNIFYHLVGTGDEVLKYQLLIEKYNIEKYVKLYGFKSGQELDAIYGKADIAINSLAIHRIGLNAESTIKSKEYAAKGLPMVSSYEIDTFSYEDNLKYVLFVEPDESPIDIVELIEFYKRLYFRSNLTISDRIRSSAKLKSDMDITLREIVEYFNT